MELITDDFNLDLQALQLLKCMPFWIVNQEIQHWGESMIPTGRVICEAYVFRQHWRINRYSSLCWSRISTLHWACHCQYCGFLVPLSALSHRAVIRLYHSCIELSLVIEPVTGIMSRNSDIGLPSKPSCLPHSEYEKGINSSRSCLTC
jgi:hypothetical protein